MSTSQSSSPSPRSWFITGASSGIGLALTRALAARGDRVTAVARNVAGLADLVARSEGRVRAGSVDVTDPVAVQTAVSDAKAAHGRIDVVVPLAGIGVSAGVEEATAEQAQEIFDITVQGTLNTLRSALPTLRAQRSGHVLTISSFLGMTASPGSGLTAASKYAIEGLSQALIGELAPLGIHVTVVEPGITRTPFIQNMRKGAAIDDYEPTVGEGRKRIAGLPASVWSDPERVAAAMISVVDSETPPVRLPTGSFALKQMKAALNARLEELEAVSELAVSVDVPVETTA